MAIKLIASDMDGSLLTSDKRLPPDFFQVLEQLHDTPAERASRRQGRRTSLPHEV